MMYKIFVPTKKEAELIFESASFKKEKHFDTLEHNNIQIIISGIGKTNTAMTISRYLESADSNELDLMLIGIAGAYRGSGIEIGTIAYVDTDFFADEALITKQNGILSIQGTNEIGFPVCKDNKVNFTIPCKSLPSLNANTVSILMGDDELSDLLHTKTGASLESMEGAAFGLAAAMAGFKAVQIRAVSNYCGCRKNQEWNIKKAVTNLQNTLDDLSILT